MISTPPPFDEVITIERKVPESFMDLQESNSYESDCLWNYPIKRPYEKTESVLFRNGLIDLGILEVRISNIYHQYRRLFNVDLKTFSRAYRGMVELMDSLLPLKHTQVSEISEADECVSNYYEFEDTKIFFNLFFDEEEDYPVAQVSMRRNGKFSSFEGPIEKVGLYLQESLNANSHV